MYTIRSIIMSLVWTVISLISSATRSSLASIGETGLRAEWSEGGKETGAYR